MDKELENDFTHGRKEQKSIIHRLAKNLLILLRRKKMM